MPLSVIEFVRGIGFSRWFAATVCALSNLAASAEKLPPCEESATAAIHTSPARAVPGDVLKIMAVAVDGAVDRLSVRDDEGRFAPMALSGKSRGGPPWSLSAAVTPSQSGRLRIEAHRNGQIVACRTIAVGAAARDSATSHQWDHLAEAFFSAWIEQMFDAPPAQELSFPSLAPVIRDPERNFLFNYFGNGEDLRFPAEPDCADLPYFLRAYFAWKNGLPIAYRACSRGSASSAPRCSAPSAITDFGAGNSSVGEFNAVLRKLLDTVHSGSARTALRDEGTDFYPVPLERESLWPGTVYADPYGHVLMIVGWQAQRPGNAGLLLAVDAQPDNSISRKRFWEGTFLFAQTPSAGPGFKAFRPILGRRSIAGNGELVEGTAFAPFSLEQASLEPEDFYARMNALINPSGQEPAEAHAAMLDALVEQLETRVTSVENGEKYRREHPSAVVPMPSGPAIFETIGPWEDYSTPSRDMRLLIALNVLERLPERIRRYPELFGLGGHSPDEVADEIQRLHRERIGERFVTYKRSDTSDWRLSVAEIYARRSAFEVGYNPNDCAESRWGAPAGSDEAATCKRHAPPDQRRKMGDYRSWFREARRPPR